LASAALAALFRAQRQIFAILWLHGELDTTDTDTLLKIQATNVQESMTIDNTMTHCIPRKINKSYKLKMDQLTKDR